jgi:hypothetical protein
MSYRYIEAPIHSLLYTQKVYSWLTIHALNPAMVEWVEVTNGIATVGILVFDHKGKWNGMRSKVTFQTLAPLPETLVPVVETLDGPSSYSQAD